MKWYIGKMKIEKRIYKIVYKGKRFLFTVLASEKFSAQEKVLVRKNLPVSTSYLNPKS